MATPPPPRQVTVHPRFIRRYWTSKHRPERHDIIIMHRPLFFRRPPVEFSITWVCIAHPRAIRGVWWYISPISILFRGTRWLVLYTRVSVDTTQHAYLPRRLLPLPLGVLCFLLSSSMAALQFCRWGFCLLSAWFCIFTLCCSLRTCSSSSCCSSACSFFRLSAHILLASSKPPEHPCCREKKSVAAATLPWAQAKASSAFAWVS